MIKPVKTLYANQGLPFSYEVTYPDVNNLPADLTNYSSVLRVAKYYGSDLTLVDINATVVSNKLVYQIPAGSLNFSGAHFYTRIVYNGVNVDLVENGIFICIPTVPQIHLG